MNSTVDDPRQPGKIVRSVSIALCVCVVVGVPYVPCVLSVPRVLCILYVLFCNIYIYVP